MRMKFLKSLAFFWLLFLSVSMNYAQEKESSNIMPYAEGTTSNFEVVIAYNDIEPNKETKLTIYISDYKTNAPIGDAKLEIEIPGIDNSKINILPTLDPGIYYVLTEFPEIKNYSFLIYITSGDKSDVVAINDVNIGLTQRITDDHKDSDSKPSILSGNIFLIIFLIIILIITALFFYRLGNRKRSSLNLKDDIEIISSEENKYEA